MTTSKRPPAWSDDENSVIAIHYVEMLTLENSGDAFNKAAYRRAGLTLMSATRDDNIARSAGSWEMKCCNISAVLNAAGLRWINGYKPLGHGQQRALTLALITAFDGDGSSGDAFTYAAADCLRDTLKVTT